MKGSGISLHIIGDQRIYTRETELLITSKQGKKASNKTLQSASKHRFVGS